MSYVEAKAAMKEAGIPMKTYFIDDMLAKCDGHEMSLRVNPDKLKKWIEKYGRMNDK